MQTGIIRQYHEKEYLNFMVKARRKQWPYWSINYTPTQKFPFLRDTFPAHICCRNNTLSILFFLIVNLRPKKKTLEWRNTQIVLKRYKYRRLNVALKVQDHTEPIFFILGSVQTNQTFLEPGLLKDQHFYNLELKHHTGKSMLTRWSFCSHFKLKHPYAKKSSNILWPGCLAPVFSFNNFLMPVVCLFARLRTRLLIRQSKTCL